MLTLKFLSVFVFVVCSAVNPSRRNSVRLLNSENKDPEEEKYNQLYKNQPQAWKEATYLGTFVFKSRKARNIKTRLAAGLAVAGGVAATVLTGGTAAVAAAGGVGLTVGAATAAAAGVGATGIALFPTKNQMKYTFKTNGSVVLVRLEKVSNIKGNGDFVLGKPQYARLINIKAPKTPNGTVKLVLKSIQGWNRRVCDRWIHYNADLPELLYTRNALEAYARMGLDHKRFSMGFNPFIMLLKKLGKIGAEQMLQMKGWTIEIPEISDYACKAAQVNFTVPCEPLDGSDVPAQL